MSTFDRYMVSQLTVTFGFFSLILVLVYWVNRAVSLFDRLISDGQTAWVFMQFTALTLPNVIVLVLPVAAFVATIYVSNTMISESEMVVAQGAGMSVFRLLRPALYFGLGVAALMAVLAHGLVPVSRAALADRQSEVSADITARFLTEGQFLHPSPGVTIYIREISDAGELLDVLLSDRTDPARATTYLADRALIVRTPTGPRLVMFEGMSQTLTAKDQRLSTLSFADFSYDLSALAGPGTRATPDVRELSTLRLLRAREADLRLTGASRAQFLAEAHARLAQPLQGVVLALIGAATLLLGGFSRFGVARQIIGAVVLVIVIQMLNNMAEDYARQNAMGWPLVYAPVLLGAVLVALIVWAAGHPRLFMGRRRGEDNGTDGAAAT